MVSAEVAFAGVSGLVSGGVCAVFVLDGATDEVFGCSLTCDTVLSGFAILELSADEPCATFALSVEDTFPAEETASLSAVVSEITDFTSPVFSDEV